MTIRWYEVWADDSSSSPYLLLLTATEGRFRIVDPREDNRIVMETDVLEKAQSFLTEDEYTLVDGRMWNEEERQE